MQTADRRQQTADNRQQTADSRQQMLFHRKSWFYKIFLDIHPSLGFRIPSSLRLDVPDLSGWSSLSSDTWSVVRFLWISRNNNCITYPVGASEFFLGFICIYLSYFTTARITFTCILYPQCTPMIFFIYTSYHSLHVMGINWTRTCFQRGFIAQLVEQRT